MGYRMGKTMKTITIQYEFSDEYEYNEIVNTINGAITDMDSSFAKELSYKVMNRRNNE